MDEKYGPSAMAYDFGNRAQCVGESRVSPFHARNCGDVVFVDDIVHALVVIGRQVAVGEVVVSQAPVAGDPGAQRSLARGGC